MFTRFQKRCSKMVTRSIEKYTPKKLKFSLTEINSHVLVYQIWKENVLYKASIGHLNSNGQFSAAAPGSSLRPAGTHSNGKARQKGFNHCPSNQINTILPTFLILSHKKSRQCLCQQLAGSSSVCNFITTLIWTHAKWSCIQWISMQTAPHFTEWFHKTGQKCV